MKTKNLVTVVHLIVLIFVSGSVVAGAVESFEKTCTITMQTSESGELIKAPKRSCRIRTCMTGYRFDPWILDEETRESLGLLPICHADLKHLRIKQMFESRLGKKHEGVAHHIPDESPNIEYIFDLHAPLNFWVESVWSD